MGGIIWRARRYDRVTTDPLPMQWAPCHPSTYTPLQSVDDLPERAWPNLGQAFDFSYRGVSPYVVCPSSSCPFYEYVRPGKARLLRSTVLPGAVAFRSHSSMMS